VQRVRVVFLYFSVGSAVELVEPAAPDSPVSSLAEKGGGFHHLCFEVDDLEAHMAFMRTQKALLVRKPQPAVAFEGRRIGWMITREKMLVEYLERTASLSK
jgi:methylmalonyl-CoA/ethylmalonyl-CoA epimerase